MSESIGNARFFEMINKTDTRSMRTIEQSQRSYCANLRVIAPEDAKALAELLRSLPVNQFGDEVVEILIG